MLKGRFYRILVCCVLTLSLVATGWWLWQCLHPHGLVRLDNRLGNPFSLTDSIFCDNEHTRPTFSPEMGEGEFVLILPEVANCSQSIALYQDLEACRGDVHRMDSVRRAQSTLAIDLLGNYLDPKSSFSGDKRILLSLCQSILEFHSDYLPLSVRTLQLWCQREMGVRDELHLLPQWQQGACYYVLGTKNLLQQLKYLSDFRKGYKAILQRTPLVDMDRGLFDTNGFDYMRDVLKCLPVEVQGRVVAVASSGCQIFTNALAILPDGKRPSSIIALDTNQQYKHFATCLKQVLPYFDIVKPRWINKAHTLVLRPEEIEVLFYVGTNHLGIQELPLGGKVLPNYMSFQWMSMAYKGLTPGGRMVICDSLRNLPEKEMVRDTATQAGFTVETEGNLPEIDPRYPGFKSDFGHEDDSFYMVFVK